MSLDNIEKPRILIIDIETFPNIGYIWGKYDQNVIRYVQQKCIAAFSAKWFGEKEVVSKNLSHYKGYKPKSYDDRKLVEDIWKLLDEADLVIAHNGDDFDIKYCQARFIFHNMFPPRPFKTVDTKKVAKRIANFNSNSLDDLGDLFGLGRKIKTDFDLWEGCINGDKESWHKMSTYNERDLLMLENLYRLLIPWVKDHPNFTQGNVACPKCGSEKIQWRGIQRAVTRDYRRFQCQSCGGWGRLVKSEKGLGTQTANIG